jgi:hypothetical protein
MPSANLPTRGFNWNAPPFTFGKIHFRRGREVLIPHRTINAEFASRHSQIESRGPAIRQPMTVAHSDYADGAVRWSGVEAFLRQGQGLRIVCSIVFSKWRFAGAPLILQFDKTEAAYVAARWVPGAFRMAVGRQQQERST